MIFSQFYELTSIGYHWAIFSGDKLPPRVLTNNINTLINKHPIVQTRNVASFILM